MKKLVQSIFVFSHSQLKIATAAFLWLLFMFGFNATQAQIIITGYMANPASTDAPYEYVQLIATQAINFSTTPYSLVWNNNGVATSAGWAAGAAISYKFDLTAGSVSAGQVFYVGGSGKLINGAGSADISGLTWIRAINNGTTSGDGGVGTANASGTFGNGGANADGIAVFSGTTVTSSTIPVDAIFLGTGVGTAKPASGGYVLPTNDIYNNLQGTFGNGTNITFFSDPASGAFIKLSGTYNAVNSTWTTPRTASTIASPTQVSDLNTSFTVVLPTPEINVKGNGVNIVDGDASPSTTDDTDFGAVSVGSSLNKTFTIENTGSATLTVSNITLTGTNSGEYSLVTPPTFPLAIAGGSTQTITVKFTPTVTTVRTATLNIFSDDSDEGTYDFALQGGTAAIPHTIAFVRNDTTVSEGVGTAKIWVKVTSVGNQTGTVNLATSAYSTATAGGTDYTAPSTLTIPSNATLNQMFSFDIPVNDDASAEADEYIIAKLTGASNLTINTTAQTTLYIRDNDKLTPTPSNQLSLSLLGSFSNGTAFSGATQINSAEISAFDSASKRVFIANSIGSKLDIVNFTNPASPSLVSSLSVTPYGSINSVAAKNGIIALAIENGTNKQLAGKVVFLDANGTLIDSVTVGAMPDMLIFNHAGTKVYTANEGEPNDTYTTDPEGSVSVIDITTLLTTGITTAANVTNIGFTAYNGQEVTLRSQGIRIYGTGASAAQDFEPEYITISEDDTKAWVTLQENNAVAELNLTNNTITQLIPLGYKNHNLVANALDASDQTFGVNLSNFPVKGMYQPDAITSYNVGGTTYFITANEGDSRAYTGMNEETRVGSMSLDATVFPNAAELKDNRVLGRLRTTNKLGDTDNDGDFDEIYCFGARSFSVWNTSTSTLIYDSGDELERITANDATYSALFNQNSGGVKKDRSDDKGPEQEGVTVGKVNGIPYAFVGMERTGGVMVYNIANPAAPQYVTYKNNRPTDVSPEGVVFVPAAQSPTGKNLLILSNEISSTLTVYQVNPCTAPGIAAISAAGSTAICAGSSVQLAITTPNGAYSYQWLKNNAAISTANAASYTANAVGDYKLAVVNTTTGCVDTSSVISVTIPADVTNPSITAPATVSVCLNSGCTAYGINLGTPVTSDNCTVASVTNNAPASFPLGNTTVTWTVTDAAGNSATSTQTVTVTDGTKPTVYLAQDNLVAGATGSSSSKTPYLLPSANGVKFTSILSVDDAIGGYAMAGIPDGLGAFDNCDGTFTLLMNHEIANTLGVNRAHGSKGAFVSKWIINKNTLSVVSGSDLMQQAYLWNTTTNSYDLAGANGAAFSRFCSADLPAVSAFYNGTTGLGTKERIFMNGEENSNLGRQIAHISTGANAGKSYELARLGKAGWENSVANPNPSNTTIVAELDDNSTQGQVYFYVGTKTNTGSEIEKAGLTNGNLYTVAVSGLAAEDRTTPPTAGTAFSLVNLGDVSNLSGATLNTNTVAAGGTSFLRPEDGAWDPSNLNDFYFATTDRIDNVKDGNVGGTQVGRSRLYRLRFTDINTPLLGGTIEAVLDGTEAQNMMDNMSIDKFGHIILTEDVGNAAHNGKIWQYTIATDNLTQIAKHDPARFGDLTTAATLPYNQDEESSGVIDVSDILGAGMHLIVDQAHYTTGISAQSVEGGQLLAMFVPAAMGVTATALDTLISYTGCGTSISLGTPATADNCSVSSITNNAPATYPLGNTTVTWTVTDGSGNTSTINQIVTVRDTVKPSITAPATASVCLNSGCTAYGINLGTPVTSDNCTVASVTNNAPASFPLGNTTVTWTVTDAAGNSATSTQTVTVTDGTKPTVYLAQDNLVAGATGSSSSKTPYLLPSANGVKFTSILSVDDAIGGYAMAGIPDGLGAFDNCDGTFTLLMNHEIANTLGVNRAHGSKGAFVSKWIINKNTLSVVSGSDLMQQAYLWNTTTNSYDLAGANGAAFSRFCSADLPAVSAFYNGTTGLGTKERIFMNGEENSNLGRQIAHISTGANAGKSYELARLGKAGWENSVANPNPSNTTIVAELDDNSTQGQVYFYVGTKTNTGSEIEKAGLTNGNLYTVAVSGLAAEDRTTPPTAGTAFSLVNLGDVSNLSGATLNTNTVAAGGTSFLRPEDGAWDPSNLNDFYFATTDRIDNVKDGNVGGTQVGRSRLYRLRFTDINTPLLGGTIEAVLDGTEAQNMMDNMSIDKFGHIILTEDVGNAAHNGKIWQYTIATDNLTQIAKHDPARFGDLTTAATLPYNQDEESSGVIDVSDILGAGMHLIVDQAHYTTGISAQSVEGGQLLAMFVPAAMGVTATALDTVIVCANNVAGNSATGVSLGTPATADNCSVSSIINNAPASFSTGYTNVTWTVTDGSGNTNTATQVVKVNAAPATPTAPATVCGFDAATMTATPSSGTIKWHDNNAHTGAALNFFGNSHVATTTGNYYAFALGSNGCYSQPATTVATVRTALPTATPTVAGTYYATEVVNDGTYNHYCRCADNTILLSVASTYTPANNFDADGTPAADAYSVKVEVGSSLITNLGNAPYNNILGINGWQVISRTWDLELGASAQEPSSAVNVISYFTDAEYSAVNAVLATPLTSPSQMTMYKLKNSPYASAMSALNAGHALIDTSKIYLFNNQTNYTAHWALNTVSAGLYSATYAVNEFSGGGGGGGNGGGVPFPILLVDFSGYNDNVVNRLQWTTEMELNTDKFVVERSIGNQFFEVIGEVSATGNSTSTQNYAFNDRTFAANTNYYRLKMLDKDGTFSYSKTIEIATNKLNVSIYPNPAQNEVFISGSFPTNAKVSISNMLGQEVLRENLDINRQTAVSLQNISKGIYMLNILNEKGAILHSEKLVKE